MARRNDRGAVFPSPVVMLSIIAVVMAGIAFVATRSDEPTERRVTTVSDDPSASPSDEQTPDATPSDDKPDKPRKPPVDRAETYVMVYNNSGITGLAGRIAATATEAGWNVVGADNWYGTIPASTVYFPERLRAEARLLGRDLGISRLKPAIAPMRLDRLTVILTSDYRA